MDTLTSDINTELTIRQHTLTHNKIDLSSDEKRKDSEEEAATMQIACPP